MQAATVFSSDYTSGTYINTIATQFLAKKITANYLEQAENQYECY